MKQLASMAVGGCLFAVSYLALGVPLAVSVLAAGGAYGAGLFLFNIARKTGSDDKTGGLDQATIRQTLNAATRKVDGIEALSRCIRKTDVKTKTEHLVLMARGILDDLRRDPKDIKRATLFLTYYLDSVTKILTHYNGLTERRIDSPEARAALEKVESLLLLLEGAFEKQRATLAMDDVLDLDSEIMILKTTLEAVGER